MLLQKVHVSVIYLQKNKTCFGPFRADNEHFLFKYRGLIILNTDDGSKNNNNIYKDDQSPINTYQKDENMTLL